MRLVEAYSDLSTVLERLAGDGERKLVKTLLEAARRIEVEGAGGNGYVVKMGEAEAKVYGTVKAGDIELLLYKSGFVAEHGLSPKDVESIAKITETYVNGALQRLATEEVEVRELNHIAEIEDPNLFGSIVAVNAVIASNSVAYVVPEIVKAVPMETRFLIRDMDPFLLKLVGVSEDKKRRVLRHYLRGLLPGKEDFNVVEEGFKIIYKLRVRPPVMALEEREEKIVDEKGFEYKAYDVYVVGHHPMSFMPSTLVRLQGVVTADPRNQRITLLAYDVKFPEEADEYDAEKLHELWNLFKKMSVEERVNWVLDEFEKFSGIVGRRNLALAGLLTFFSPIELCFEGERRRGWANTVFIGDTTTGKSETVRNLIRLLGAGAIITGETASRVGLLGSAVQMPREGWFIEWGLLVLYDRKLLAIDEASRLDREAWGALNQSDRTGIVTITKAGKGRAYARTRKIRIFNPLDPQTRTVKTLKDFYHPILAITTVLDKTEISRLDLLVHSDSRDVPPEEINAPRSKEYDDRIKLLRETLRWCWSNKANIVFDGDAEKMILDEATRLYHKFHIDEVPLINAETKHKLALLSAALAFLTLSTDRDFNTVRVTREHVEYVVRFIEEEYEKAGLHVIAEQRRREEPTEDDLKDLLEEVKEKTDIDEETAIGIINFIATKGCITKAEITERFELTEKRQLRPLIAILSNYGLLRRGNRGYYPTARLIQLAKLSQTLPGLPCLPGQRKYPPVKSGEKVGGSPPRAGRPGRQGKEEGKLSVEEAIIRVLRENGGMSEIKLYGALEELRRRGLIAGLVDWSSLQVALGSLESRRIVKRVPVEDKGVDLIILDTEEH